MQQEMFAWQLDAAGEVCLAVKCGRRCLLNWWLDLLLKLFASRLFRKNLKYSISS